MAYTRQTWTSGDVITAEKLNHIEEGINNGGGLQLYGPYIITSTVNGSITAQSGGTTNFILDTITDLNNNIVVPTGSNVRFVLAGMASPNDESLIVNAPVVTIENGSFNPSDQAKVYAIYNTTYYNGPLLYVYSDTEFELDDTLSS